jgi:hypothetical protein
MTGLMLSAKALEDTKKNIYVAPPTLHDPTLNQYQSYINSMLVSSANVNKHWVLRSNRASEVLIYDKHTINRAVDTTCNYNRPVVCSHENLHWLMVTDIFTTQNFATVIVKLYDEDTQLIATATKSSYSIQECKEQVKETTVKKGGRQPVEIIEKLPQKCTILEPKILARDINQAVTIMFASIHPMK